MTTVEEELLLSEPVANDYDSLAAIDVDLLLGAGDISRKPTTDDTTDAILLDSVEQAPEQDSEQVPGLKKNIKAGEDVESEKEELDYDEEEDDDDGRRERTSRYTSERKGASRQNSEDGEGSKKENGDRKTKRPGIPSLFDKTITNNPMKSGDQPIGVILRIEGEAERVFYPPPSFMMQLNQPIVPRLPNGIPLIGMPSNHGRAGFGVGYQQQHQSQGRLMGGGGVGVMPGQWDNEVERFLSSTNSRGAAAKKRRSASYSSASSYSSDSRSRSRSSSRSERRKRDEKRRRRDDRRYERRDERESVRRDDRKDFRRGDDKRRHNDKRARDRDSYSERRRKEQSKKSTIESAKALGLSNDYIERVNEQKRLRDEHIKKKEERRFCPSSSETRERKEASVPSTSAHKDTLIKDKGTKAYLAVNVCGVQQLTTAVKKIEALANELGPIKICWRSADDVVSIIFNAHDKAKDFMIKYNGKVLSGLRITVSLEKKFLNLAELN